MFKSEMYLCIAEMEQGRTDLNTISSRERVSGKDFTNIIIHRLK
jgi:hypothetical protein